MQLRRALGRSAAGAAARQPHQPPISVARSAPARERGLTVAAASAPGSSAQQQQPLLALHVGDTTISAPVPRQQAAAVDAALARLMSTFAEKQQAAGKRKRWDSLDLRFTGEDAGPGLELLEVFCNPNAFATAFDAKLLVTIRAAGGLRVSCEPRLAALKSDLDAFLAG